MTLWVRSYYVGDSFSWDGAGVLDRRGIELVNGKLWFAHVFAKSIPRKTSIAFTQSPGYHAVSPNSFIRSTVKPRGRRTL